MPAEISYSLMSETRRLLLARISIVAGGVLGVLVVFWTLYWTYYWSPITLLVPTQRARWLSWSVHLALGGVFCLLGSFLLMRAGQQVGVLYLGAFIVAQGLAIGYWRATWVMLEPGDWKRPLVLLLVNWLSAATALRAVQTFPRKLDVADVRLVSTGSSLPGSAWKPIEWLIDVHRVWYFTAVLFLLSIVIGRDNWAILLIVLVVLGTMAANYRAGKEVVRRKVYWLVLGAELLLVAQVFLLVSHILIEWLAVGSGIADPRGLFQFQPLYSIVNELVWAAANLGLLICFGMAIFYQGALDPRLAVRRTAVSSLGTGILLLAFAAVEEFLAEMISDALDLNQMIVTVIAGAIVALSIRPLHDFLTENVERWLPKTDGAGGLGSSAPSSRPSSVKQHLGL